ncbi:type II toxin-antitoxin system VapC family toxin [Ruania zhangjianzhongii]|uniref:type II toxin-antitoxin system VapC family toxin n=1 Tax=Ruania zhangjianzhongii TaxID=2603206 RepID=UPI0011CCC1C1|nr:type II toxin-antitoxin system VapC family toxin [Ruania zhangjianzhongii]
MIVDTSALIAVLLGEDDAPVFARLLAARPVRISAATLVEARIVIESRVGPAARRRLEDLLHTIQAEVVPVDEEQAFVASEAYRDYGRGSGHAAGLNFGDCFSYALATTRREELLYKGEDLGHTDIRRAAR